MRSYCVARRMTKSASSLLVAMILLAATAQAQCLEVTTQNESIVRRAFDNWIKGGTNIFAELLASEVRWTIHGSGPVAGTYFGLKDFVERASAPLVSRLKGPITPKVHHIWAVGDTVIVRFDGSATTTSGAPYANQFVWIFRMANGVVIEAEAFLDLVAYQQVVDNNAPRTK